MWSTPLEIYRRSWDDRWYARVILPNAWIAPDPTDGSVSFGALRRHADSDAIETSPTAALPWRIRPGRVTANLSTWE